MVICLGSLVQLCCGEGGALQTNTTGMCGGSQSVWATLGSSTLTVCVLSWFTLLRLQVALQGNCLKRALDCMHFPDLSHSGSGSWVLHKGTNSVGPVFCALPRSEQLRRPGAWQAHSPQVGGASYLLPGPGRLVSRRAQWEHRLRCAVCLL